VLIPVEAIFRAKPPILATENILFLSEAYFETIKEIVSRYFAFQ